MILIVYTLCNITFIDKKIKLTKQFYFEYDYLIKHEILLIVKNNKSYKTIFKVYFRIREGSKTFLSLENSIDLDKRN